MRNLGYSPRLMEPESNKAKTNKQKTKRAKQPASPAAAAGRAYPVEPQALESQQQRLKDAAEAAAIALKAPAAAKAAAKAPAKAPAAPATRRPAQKAPPEPQAPALPPQSRITFTLADFGASEVYLSGEFNGWADRALPLVRQPDGHWETSLNLLAGRYHYKFIIDGNWIPDPLAKENVLNEYGTLNSVIEVITPT
jgi:hypothetical protein